MGPGLGGFPGMSLLGNRRNRGNAPLLSIGPSLENTLPNLQK